MLFREDSPRNSRQQANLRTNGVAYYGPLLVAAP
jgi:hypothetical protein